MVTELLHYVALASLALLGVGVSLMAWAFRP